MALSSNEMRLSSAPTSMLVLLLSRKSMPTVAGRLRFTALVSILASARSLVFTKDTLACGVPHSSRSSALRLLLVLTARSDAYLLKYRRLTCSLASRRVGPNRSQAWASGWMFAVKSFRGFVLSLKTFESRPKVGMERVGVKARGPMWKTAFADASAPCPLTVATELTTNPPTSRRVITAEAPGSMVVSVDRERDTCAPRCPRRYWWQIARRDRSFAGTVARS